MDAGLKRRCRRNRSGRLVAIGTILVLLALAGTAAAMDNTASTHAYLQAGYELDQAVLHNAPASRSALTALAARIGNECHGVLAGAPNEELGPPTEHSTTPRARGERQRSEIQLQTIEGELDLSVYPAIYQPDRAAIEAYAAQITPLSWSDPRIAPLVRFGANRLKEFLSPPAVDACADMKTWAQSGYHVLSPASREFEAARTAHLEATRPRGSIGSLLKPYEGPRERALVRQARALRPRISKALVSALGMIARLHRALGMPENLFEEREDEPVLGRGVTRAGSTFVVRYAKPGGPFGPSCRHPISVDFEERSKNSGGSSGSGTSVCLNDHSRRRPSGGCGSEVQSITAAVPAAVRTVRLLLSNGQTIVSSVVRVPRRYGGPGGVYVQAVRGYSPHPVSLTELDRNGHVVLVENLSAIRCRREPPVTGPTFIELARGTTAAKTPFVIQASIVHFGRGQTSFNLELTAGLHGNLEELTIGEAKPKAFSWSVGSECPPHEFAIVYGILSAPGDSVLARTPAGLVPLTKVPIAADLHSGGSLAYGAFSTLPLELIVRRSDGSTLYSESLAAKGKEDTEFCEGYAEG